MRHSAWLISALTILALTIAPANAEPNHAVLDDAAKCGGTYVVLAPTVEKLGDTSGSDALRIRYYTWLAYGDNVIKADPRKSVGSMIEFGLKAAKQANQLEAGEKNRYWNRLLDECHDIETALGEGFSAGKARAEKTVRELRDAKLSK